MYFYDGSRTEFKACARFSLQYCLSRVRNIFLHQVYFLAAHGSCINTYSSHNKDATGAFIRYSFRTRWVSLTDALRRHPEFEWRSNKDVTSVFIQY